LLYRVGIALLDAIDLLQNRTISLFVHDYLNITIEPYCAVPLSHNLCDIQNNKVPAVILPYKALLSEGLEFDFVYFCFEVLKLLGEQVGSVETGF
jgi:hypothetical protein